MKNLILLSVILLIARICYFTEPYGVSVDESTYMTMAESLHRGGTLYVDTVDRKPPALIWLYQSIGSVTGEWNLHGVHLAFLLIGFLLCLSFSLFVKSAGYSRSEALFSGFCFAIFSSCFPREIISANAEWPMLLLSVLSFAAFVKGVDSKNKIQPFWVFSAALLAGLAVFFKQYSILIFAGITVAWAVSSRKISEITKVFVLSALGGAIAFLIVASHFYFRGAFEDFMNYCFLDGLKYVADSREVKNNQISGIWASLGMLGAWLPLWIVVALAFFQCPMNALRKMGLGGGLGALATIYLSGRYYTHYFLPLIWFLCLVAPIGFERLKSIGLRRALVSLSLLIFLGFAVFNTDRDRFSKSWTFNRDRQAQIKELSEWIKVQSSPSDRILVWGMASQIYTMSERGAGSRFLFADFPSGRQPGLKSPDSRPTPGAMETYLADIQKNRPLFWIDTSSAALNDYGFFPLDRFLDLKAVIENQYTGPTEISGFKVWKLKI